MAFRVKYDGNGNTSGQPPVDNNSYNANDTVQVLEPFLPRDGITVAPANTVAGSLARAGAIFAYWNTMADGTGTGFYWPAGGSSFAIVSNVTIFAQWFITDGLQNGGASTHYSFGYDSALQNSASNPAGPEPARTNALMNACEADYQIMSNWFGGNYTLNGVVTVPILVYTGNLSGGANASGNVVLKPGLSGTSDDLRCLLVAEVTEYFMHAQNKGWGFVGGVGNEESSGEALSLFLTQQFALIENFANPYSFIAHTANGWLNTSLPTSDPNSTRFWDGPTGYDYGSRADYVNSFRPYPGNGPGTGCSILFLYYLYHQLGFTIEQIIAAAPGFTNGNLNSTATLRGVYQNLTGDTGDPFPFFKSLLDLAFPPDVVSSIPGPNIDDPFPIARMSFLVDKSTFGEDEVQDVINTGGGNWPNAFWLVVEGFSKISFNGVGASISLSGSFLNLAGVTITQSVNIDFENAANPQAPQRIRIPFDITFSGASLAGFPSASAVYELDAVLTSGGTNVPGSDASTQFELVGGADPYFTNIDPTQNNVYYRSQDLRVFAFDPTGNDRPVPGGPTFPNAENPSPADGYKYTQSLLSWLNGTYADTSGPDPFNTVLPSQGSALTADSSVTPKNYNFAVARVRLRGSAGAAGAASNVRVFFRLWSTETADADYQTDSTYPFTSDASGLPAAPLVGLDHQTLPFFASGDFSGNTDYGMNGVNIRNIQIANGKDSIWAYFGCFLNLYDPTDVIDGNPVQAWLNGTHHCLVAQIAYDGAPIVAGANPISSDKLAQRNLQITLSDNPGGPETHRIPQTFDIRPSAGLVDSSSYPDELMIDWGAIPSGSVASVYWPQVHASDVIALASRLYSSHTLASTDASTIQCKVTGGVTYIPIPPGGTQNFAGLFTVELPTTVVAGQEFDIVVRRVSSRTAPAPVVISLQLISPPQKAKPFPGAKSNAKLSRAGGLAGVPAFTPSANAASSATNWRFVVGAFQVKIPVVDGNTMLVPEEDTLAILKWRFQRMAPSNRWHPVFQRYLSYISARVRGLGGDPDAIPPSLSGAPARKAETPLVSYTGKIAEVIYNCFGDLEAFVLESCSGRHRFKSNEKGIGEIVLRACRERMAVTVHMEPPPRNRIREIVIRSCSNE